MKSEPITETVPLWELDAYLARHNLVIVPASLSWRGDEAHIQTRRTPLGSRDTQTD